MSVWSALLYSNYLHPRRRRKTISIYAISSIKYNTPEMQFHTMQLASIPLTRIEYSGIICYYAPACLLTYLTASYQFRNYSIAKSCLFFFLITCQYRNILMMTMMRHLKSRLNGKFGTRLVFSLSFFFNSKSVFFLVANIIL